MYFLNSWPHVFLFETSTKSVRPLRVAPILVTSQQAFSICHQIHTHTQATASSGYQVMVQRKNATSTCSFLFRITWIESKNEVVQYCWILSGLNATVTLILFASQHRCFYPFSAFLNTIVSYSTHPADDSDHYWLLLYIQITTLASRVIQPKCPFLSHGN